MGNYIFNNERIRFTFYRQENYIQYLHNLYYIQSEVQRLQSNESASVKICKGVRQECPLSPLLFNFYIQKRIMEVKDKHNGLCIGIIKVGGILISIIRFADDIVLLTRNRAISKNPDRDVND